MAALGQVLVRAGKTLDFVWQPGCPHCARAKPVVERAARALGLALLSHELGKVEAPFPVGIVPALRFAGRVIEAAPETEPVFTTLRGLAGWIRAAMPRPRRRAFGYVDFR